MFYIVVGVEDVGGTIGGQLIVQVKIIDQLNFIIFHLYESVCPNR